MFGIPSLDELLLPTLQSEEDKQLQDELEMLVERLGVSRGVNMNGCIFWVFPICLLYFIWGQQLLREV